MLTGKTILIISPQSWGKMFVSKHHYAVELAKRGNTVYFLNPPDEKLQNNIIIKNEVEGLSLFCIYHKINFPYFIKFHAIGLFHWLMKGQVKKILKAIGRPLDIIWSFDLENLYPFRLFPGKVLRIFHPVDEPRTNNAILAAEGADVIFSVTYEILEKYHSNKAPKWFINHGISADFLNLEQIEPNRRDKLYIGVAGNLLRPDIDHKIFLQIIDENVDIIFECWGSYHFNDANLAGEENREIQHFIKALQLKPNVRLHGAVGTKELVKGFAKMDGFLICYDVIRDQSKGTNYHKIIEFLSTGKVVISNNVSTYERYPGLIEMVKERDSNENLPILFKKIINDVGVHNSKARMEYRMNFANNNSYQKHLNEIEYVIFDKTTAEHLDEQI